MQLKSNNRQSAVKRWTGPWPTLRPFRSKTIKVVALSISVATVAIICNYVRPSLDMF